jgi:hypothetical protein
MPSNIGEILTFSVFVNGVSKFGTTQTITTSNDVSNTFFSYFLLFQPLDNVNVFLNCTTSLSINMGGFISINAID